MCIYCGTTKYRKIYENHYGPVPRDNEGKKFHIHHIDGDRTNNHPDNLVAVSIYEHYNIHYSQGDWGACLKLARLMNLSNTQLTELAIKSNERQIAAGTHPFMRREDGTSLASDRVKNGTNPFLGGEMQRTTQRKRVENGTHHLLGGEIQKKLVEKGTHLFLSKEWQALNLSRQFANGKHPSQAEWTCERCGKSGKGSTNFKRWHGDNCTAK